MIPSAKVALRIPPPDKHKAEPAGRSGSFFQVVDELINLGNEFFIDSLSAFRLLVFDVAFDEVFTAILVFFETSLEVFVLIERLAMEPSELLFQYLAKEQLARC
jgi:hypothetical protein